MLNRDSRSIMKSPLRLFTLLVRHKIHKSYNVRCENDVARSRAYAHLKKLVSGPLYMTNLIYITNGIPNQLFDVDFPARTKSFSFFR